MSERGVAAVVVTYHPDLDALARLLPALTTQAAPVFVVDNSERDDARMRVAACARAAGAVLVTPGSNVGIAAAQNAGIAAARAAGAAYVLLCDDDSQPPPDMTARLLAGMRTARAAGARVAAVGPLVLDARAGDAPLCFADTLLGPRRRAITPRAHGAAPDAPADPHAQVSDRTPPIPAAFLLASGCLIAIDALDAVGGMREDLFIDHVDLEWGLRARRAGWQLLVLPQARLDHQLGDRVVRLPTPGRRTLHVHAPLRNYYLVRNTVLLLRGRLLPPGWRLGYLLWLVRYAAFNLVFVAPRAERARMILRGLADGLRGRAGRAPHGPGAAGHD